MTEQENLILIKKLHEIVNKHKTFALGEPHLLDLFRILNTLYKKGILKEIFNINGKPRSFYFNVKRDDIDGWVGDVSIDYAGITSYGVDDRYQKFRDLINQGYKNYNKNNS